MSVSDHSHHWGFICFYLRNSFFGRLEKLQVKITHEHGQAYVHFCVSQVQTNAHACASAKGYQVTTLALCIRTQPPVWVERFGLGEAVGVVVDEPVALTERSAARNHALAVPQIFVRSNAMKAPKAANGIPGPLRPSKAVVRAHPPMEQGLQV